MRKLRGASLAKAQKMGGGGFARLAKVGFGVGSVRDRTVEGVRELGDGFARGVWGVLAEFPRVGNGIGMIIHIRSSKGERNIRLSIPD